MNYSINEWMNQVFLVWLTRSKNIYTRTLWYHWWQKSHKMTGILLLLVSILSSTFFIVSIHGTFYLQEKSTIFNYFRDMGFLYLELRLIWATITLNKILVLPILSMITFSCKLLWIFDFDLIHFLIITMFVLKFILLIFTWK